MRSGDRHWINLPGIYLYSSGSIVTINSDSVRGYILDGTDEELGMEIRFKKERPETEYATYAASDLAGFGVDYGRTFKRF